MTNEAETKILEILRASGCQAIQSPDWLAKKDGKWFCVEVKAKALFEPPPFWGIGLNKSQVYLRKQLLKDFGMRTILTNLDTKTDVFYWGWLDELEKGEFYDTPKKIRIYPLENFKASHNTPNLNLGGRLN